MRAGRHGSPSLPHLSPSLPHHLPLPLSLSMASEDFKYWGAYTAFPFLALQPPLLAALSSPTLKAWGLDSPLWATPDKGPALM